MYIFTIEHEPQGKELGCWPFSNEINAQNHLMLWFINALVFLEFGDLTADHLEFSLRQTGFALASKLVAAARCAQCFGWKRLTSSSKPASSGGILSCQSLASPSGRGAEGLLRL